MEEVSGAGILADRVLAITDGPPAARMAVTIIMMSPPYKKRLQSDKRCGSRLFMEREPRVGSREGQRTPHLKRLTPARAHYLPQFRRQHESVTADFPW